MPPIRRSQRIIAKVNFASPQDHGNTSSAVQKCVSTAVPKKPAKRAMSTVKIEPGACNKRAKISEMMISKGVKASNIRGTYSLQSADQIKACLEEMDKGKENCQWPECLKKKMWVNLKKENPWLICTNGTLGCSVCKSVKVTLKNSKLLKISKKWAACTIQISTKDLEKAVLVSRKTILSHKMSETHKKAEKFATDSRKNDKSTENALRTAYYLAKMGKPISDFRNLIKLQKSTGVEIALYSRTDCADMVNLIAAEMRERMNLISPGLGNNLLVSNMLFIKKNGPPVSEFPAQNFVQMWKEAHPKSANDDEDDEEEAKNELAEKIDKAKRKMYELFQNLS